MRAWPTDKFKLDKFAPRSLTSIHEKAHLRVWQGPIVFARESGDPVPGYDAAVAINGSRVRRSGRSRRGMESDVECGHSIRRQPA